MSMCMELQSRARDVFEKIVEDCNINKKHLQDTMVEVVELWSYISGILRSHMTLLCVYVGAWMNLS